MIREYAFWDLKSNVDRDESSIDEIRKREEKKLDERVKIVFNSTGIDLDEKFDVGSGSMGKTGEICPFGVGIEKEGFVSKKQLNIAEAHEKGHGVRSFDEDSIMGIWIKNGFDFSKVSAVSKDDLSRLRPLYNKGEDDVMSDDVLAKEYFRGFQNPDEIIERMSQLKNYFGMSDNRKFTKEHLEYARKNYIKDVGWTLQIKPFFEAITKDTEKNFLDVINNLGV